MAKGGSLEREICWTLSRWWVGNRRELIFWRTSNSGGGATVRARRGVSNKSHAGDITAIEETGRPFTDLITVEAKAGYNKKKRTQGSIHDLFDRTNQRTLYEEWIVQAQEASVRAGTKFWMIVHHRDGRRTMCYFPSRLYALLTVDPIRCFERMPIPFMSMTTKVRMKGKEVTVPIVGMGFERFLGLVDPDDIRVLAEQLRSQ